MCDTKLLFNTINHVYIYMHSLHVYMYIYNIYMHSQVYHIIYIICDIYIYIIYIYYILTHSPATIHQSQHHFYSFTNQIMA